MSLLAQVYLFAFAAFAIVGGIIGFLKAKSRASLIAGAASGLLLGVAGLAIGAGHARAGAVLGLVLSIALLGRFAPGYRASRKLFPAGIMALLAAGGILLSGAALLVR